MTVSDEQVEAAIRAHRRAMHRRCCTGAALDDICALPIGNQERHDMRAALDAALSAVNNDA